MVVVAVVVMVAAVVANIYIALMCYMLGMCSELRVPPISYRHVAKLRLCQRLKLFLSIAVAVQGLMLVSSRMV